MTAGDDGDGDAVRRFDVVHVVVGAERGERAERVAHEEPLELQINGHSVAVVMRTPGRDEELGVGFCLTERIVARVDDIASVRHCDTAPDPEAEDNVLQLRLAPSVPFELERLRRHTFASSSCGVCGKATIENACAIAAPLTDDARIAAAQLASLPALLRAAQPGFDATGGLHAAALFAVEDGGAPPRLLVAREDVGRHNAVDKCVGWLARARVEPSTVALLVSGRVSFEIVQKAAAARLPIVAGISAPSSLAVRMARALDVTVVGFLRGPSMNVYASARRVQA